MTDTAPEQAPPMQAFLNKPGQWPQFFKDFERKARALRVWDHVNPDAVTTLGQNPLTAFLIRIHQVYARGFGLQAGHQEAWKAAWDAGFKASFPPSIIIHLHLTQTVSSELTAAQADSNVITKPTEHMSFLAVTSSHWHQTQQRITEVHMWMLEHVNRDLIRFVDSRLDTRGHIQRLRELCGWTKALEETEARDQNNRAMGYQAVKGFQHLQDEGVNEHNPRENLG